eukprot:1069391-Prorocentrum_minimum.AAC.6
MRSLRSRKSSILEVPPILVNLGLRALVEEPGRTTSSAGSAKRLVATSMANAKNKNWQRKRPRNNRQSAEKPNSSYEMRSESEETQY